MRLPWPRVRSPLRKARVARYAHNMNVDQILETMNAHGVAYLLIGGMNFLLRHEPVLTYDVDLWIQDTADNRRRCSHALAALEGAWGPTEAEWKPVAQLPDGWLERQSMFALTTAHGALDVFRSLPGLDDWTAAFQAAYVGRTAGGAAFHGLSDADMLRCQEALDESDRKPERIRSLRRALGSASP